MPQQQDLHKTPSHTAKDTHTTGAFSTKCHRTVQQQKAKII